MKIRQITDQDPARYGCGCTGCEERGAQWITPVHLDGVPDAPPMVMCAGHSVVALQAQKARAQQLRRAREAR